MALSKMKAPAGQYMNENRERNAWLVSTFENLNTPVGQYMKENRERNAWLVSTFENLNTPPFVHKYTKAISRQPDLQIITSDGDVTFAHQYKLARNSLYFYHKLYRSSLLRKRDYNVIKEDTICKEALVLILRLLYCNECVAGPAMEKYGPEVMVASLLFTLNSKHLIVSAMKDSLTPQNCLDVWKAIETCEIKYYDDFYSHPALGLKAKCKEIMERCLSHERECNLQKE